MIRQTALLLCALALSSAAHARQAESRMNAENTAQQNAPPRIMVLGVFHFTGGGRDLINPEVDDFLSAARQAEIAEVLDRLETFAPTKIAVELGPEHDAEFNARYDAYRAGDHALSVNEREQLGMALAARLDHDRLYPVDYARTMSFGLMTGAADEAGQTGLLDQFGAVIGEVQTAMAANSAPELSVLERLRFQNSPAVSEYHNLYLLLAQMGSLENPAGAEQMEGWWGRNMRIFANIAYIAEPGDRILVIYGSGHKALLDAYIEAAPNLERVEAMDYLRESPAALRRNPDLQD